MVFCIYQLWRGGLLQYIVFLDTNTHNQPNSLFVQYRSFTCTFYFSFNIRYDMR